MPESMTRHDCLRLADRMLTAAHRHASPGHARITLPGPEGGYGRDVDGLEGFARTFLLAGFRIAGTPEQDTGLAEWYARGLATGTDPYSAERWVRLDEHGQAKVEAASIALILDLTRPWIWDRLKPSVQEQVVDYLSPAVGDETYPQINWVWFRLVVQTFLRSVGGPHSLPEMAADLAVHDTFRRDGGWMSDGPERAYDHYAGWALHLYPVLWARMAGAADLAAGRRERDVAALDRFLGDALHLVGGDGSPLLQGRSLTYRFAAAAPFWAGALAEVPSHSPGRLRHAATSIVGHFAANGAPDDDGLLTIGWHRPWPRLAQSYSGPGSPYWAAKGLLGIALPADHPVWTAPAEPLPVQAADTLRAAVAPGWLISGTTSDGLVRVVNHGTDHATEGAGGGDSPLYARLGYSTGTAPLLDEGSWISPADMAVTLVDASGRATHRTGMRTLAVHVDTSGPVPLGVAASTGPARWLAPEPCDYDHGKSRPGASRTAGRLTVISLVRGPWELRLARVDDPAPAATTLRFTGWPATAPLTTTLECVTSGLDASPTFTRLDFAVEHEDAGPLGSPTRVPAIDLDVRPGAWRAVLAGLTGGPAATGTPACELAGPEVRITWPDGISTRTHLALVEE